jgi:hypothetical protein
VESNIYHQHVKLVDYNSLLLLLQVRLRGLPPPCQPSCQTPSWLTSSQNGQQQPLQHWQPAAAAAAAPHQTAAMQLQQQQQVPLVAAL